MRRVTGWIGLAVCLAVTAAAPTNALARDQGAEFAAAYQTWQQARDVEDTIRRGEELIAREAGLAAWPLSEPRDRVRATLLAEVAQAYLGRTEGVRADNVELAIERFDRALALLSRERDASVWAVAHNNAGIAYILRPRGEPGGNQEKAIAHLEAALSVLTPTSDADRWARANVNLATVYVRRMSGDRASNRAAAIRHLEAAQKVFSRAAKPFEWAQVQVNLAAAFQAPGAIDRAADLARAIASLENALTVFTRAANPQQWAVTNANLAVAHRSRPAPDAEAALRHDQAALQVFTPRGTPLEWAAAQEGLARDYDGRKAGDPADNQTRAIAAFTDALSVYTPDAAPADHLRVARALAHLHMRRREWVLAAALQTSARGAFEVLVGEGLDAEATRAMIAEAGPLFQDAAFTKVEKGDLESAVLIASEGRARMLAASLKLKDTTRPAADQRRIGQLSAAIRAGSARVAGTTGTDRLAALDALSAQRDELRKLLRASEPADAKGAALLGPVRKLSESGAALVVPIVSGFGTRLVLYTGGRDSVGRDPWTSVELPELPLDALTELLAGKAGADAWTGGGWVESYFINYLDGPERQAAWPRWLAAVEGLGPKLWQLIGARLDAALASRGVKPGARLVWMPTGWLALLPLGIAEDPATRRRLGARYEIVNVQSLAALAAAERRLARSDASPATLAVVVNPTGDLPGTEKEAAIVAAHFEPGRRTVLARAAATPAAVLAGLAGKSYWHFASHGMFSWQDAAASGLILHDGEPLTVAALRDAAGLAAPRLVVLSACETGLSDVTRNPDEFVGLPGSFAALGAQGVVSTLWPVADGATALLIAKFYDLHLGRARLAPPTALARAQAWLAGASADELNGYARAAAASRRIEQRHVDEIARAVTGDGEGAADDARGMHEGAAPEDDRTRTLFRPFAGRTATAANRPFAHPYFWAGFVYTGL